MKADQQRSERGRGRETTRQGQSRKRLRSRLLMGGAIAGVALIAYIPAMRAGFIWDDINYFRQDPPTVGRDQVGEMEGVDETYRLILDRYYRPIDGPRLRRGAVNGMVSTLDAFSSYVPPDKLKAFSSRMSTRN